MFIVTLGIPGLRWLHVPLKALKLSLIAALMKCVMSAISKVCGLMTINDASRIFALPKPCLMLKHARKCFGNDVKKRMILMGFVCCNLCGGLRKMATLIA
jgi:hypothetical protein